MSQALWLNLVLQFFIYSVLRFSIYSVLRIRCNGPARKIFVYIFNSHIGMVRGVFLGSVPPTQLGQDLPGIDQKYSLKILLDAFYFFT